MDDPTTWSVCLLADALREGTLRAQDVLDAYLNHLRAVHDATNCVAAWDAERARATAAALDNRLGSRGPVGPLHGVPITVKDWIDVEGLPCTGGLIEHVERRPKLDATVVSRLRVAGAIVMAKTTVQAETELHGIVRNPHDPARSPGGSSSGEAAAIGGGGSPLGLGSDSGGSLRLPAAWCGVSTLKPTAGRVPNTGHFPYVAERSDGRTQIGPLARHVEDLELVLGVIGGPDGMDPGVPPVRLGSSDEVDLNAITVAAACEDGWEPIDAVREAVEKTVKVLEQRGARRVSPPRAFLDESLDITKRYWSRTQLSGVQTARQLWDWDKFRRRMLVATEAIDVLVLPTTIGVAPEHRPLTGEDYVFTLPASLSGAPAISVPAGTEDHLPVGVQLVGRPWDDHVVLAAAKAIAHEIGT